MKIMTSTRKITKKGFVIEIDGQFMTNNTPLTYMGFVRQCKIYLSSNLSKAYIINSTRKVANEILKDLRYFTKVSTCRFYPILHLKKLEKERLRQSHKLLKRAKIRKVTIIADTTYKVRI